MIARWVLRILILAFLYGALVNSFSFPDLLMGGGLAVVLTALLWRFNERGPYRSRWRATTRALLFAPVLVGVVMGQIVRGAWQVFQVAIGIKPVPPQGLVDVPFGARSVSGVLATGWIATLSPGLVLVDIDWERRIYTVHAFDASNPATVVAEQLRFYERTQRHVIP